LKFTEIVNKARHCITFNIKIFKHIWFPKKKIQTLLLFLVGAQIFVDQFVQVAEKLTEIIM